MVVSRGFVYGRGFSMWVSLASLPDIGETTDLDSFLHGW